MDVSGGRTGPGAVARSSPCVECDFGTLESAWTLIVLSLRVTLDIRVREDDIFMFCSPRLLIYFCNNSCLLRLLCVHCVGFIVT